MIHIYGGYTRSRGFQLGASRAHFGARRGPARPIREALGLTSISTCTVLHVPASRKRSHKLFPVARGAPPHSRWDTPRGTAWPSAPRGERALPRRRCASRRRLIATRPRNAVRRCAPLPTAPRPPTALPTPAHGLSTLHPSRSVRRAGRLATLPRAPCHAALIATPAPSSASQSTGKRERHKAKRET